IVDKLSGMNDTLYHMKSSTSDVLTKQDSNNIVIVDKLSGMNDTLNHMKSSTSDVLTKQDSYNKELIDKLYVMSSTLNYMNSTTKDFQELHTTLVKDIKHQVVDCPLSDGFFMLPDSTECFKSIREKLTWAAADAKCKSEGLALARPEPQNAVALRKYLVDTYDGGWHWLGGKTDGQYMKWTDNQDSMSASNPLWWPGHASYVSTGNCLWFLSDNSHWKPRPDHPYASRDCSQTLHPLCELIME
ncbi:unnamed protein product, partial [Meganyctiphanes norvegica]